MLIDAHCHIYLDDYDEDRDETFARAHEAGVELMGLIGIDFETNETVRRIANERDDCFYTLGFHPHDAKKYDEARFREQVEALGEGARAIGEIGLDYHYMNSPAEVQRKTFESAFAVARERGLPIVVHTREAEADTLAILESAGPKVNGKIHCFSGDMAFLENVLALGMGISVGGPVTYPRAEVLRDVVRAVPREKFLLETDCPWLSPQKKRGKRNEPAYLAMTALKVAELWETTPEEVARQTTENAKAFFGLD